MITLQQALSSASKKPLSEWDLAELLAYEIFHTDTKIKRLHKELAQAEEHSQRVKRQWNDLMQKYNRGE